jgi:hypothetical protein
MYAFYILCETKDIEMYMLLCLREMKGAIQLKDLQDMKCKDVLNLINNCNTMLAKFQHKTE